MCRFKLKFKISIFLQGSPYEASPKGTGGESDDKTARRSQTVIQGENETLRRRGWRNDAQGQGKNI